MSVNQSPILSAVEVAVAAAADAVVVALGSSDPRMLWPSVDVLSCKEGLDSATASLRERGTYCNDIVFLHKALLATCKETKH